MGGDVEGHCRWDRWDVVLVGLGMWRLLGELGVGRGRIGWRLYARG